MPRGRKRKAWQPCAVVGLSDNGLRKDAADWLNRREICHSPLTMSSTRGSPVLLCKCIECDGCSKDLFFCFESVCVFFLFLARFLLGSYVGLSFCVIF